MNREQLTELRKVADGFDLKHIAIANPATILSLLDHVERLEKQRDELMAVLEKVCGKSHKGTVWLDIEEVDALKAAIASVKESK